MTIVVGIPNLFLLLVLPTTPRPDLSSPPLFEFFILFLPSFPLSLSLHFLFSFPVRQGPSLLVAPPRSFQEVWDKVGVPTVTLDTTRFLERLEFLNVLWSLH